MAKTAAFSVLYVGVGLGLVVFRAHQLSVLSEWWHGCKHGGGIGSGQKDGRCRWPPGEHSTKATIYL
jgi:hypothetical protein